MKSQVFYCEACDNPVRRGDSECSKCGRPFDGVKCPKCGFRGTGERFNNGCPSCGYSATGDLAHNKGKIFKKAFPFWRASLALLFLSSLLAYCRFSG